MKNSTMMDSCCMSMKIMLKFMLIVLFTCYANSSSDDASYMSRNMNPIDPGVWDLPAGSMYDKIFEITDKNHGWKVMECNDAWIVVFYKKRLHKKWKDLSEVIGGSVWFGSADIDKEATLAGRLKIDMENFDENVGMAVIYPMVAVKKEEALAKGELKITKDAREAELFVSANIPDRSIELDFSPESQQRFNDWIVKGYYYEQPGKFPVICMTDDTETPINVKVLSHYFYTHFNFGIVRKKNIPAMRQQFQQVPEPQTFPTFLVLLGKEPSSDEMLSGQYDMHFNIMPFIEKKYGDGNHFRSLLNYMMTVNTDYRKTLPGRNPSEPDHVANLEEIRTRLRERVEFVHKSKKKSSKKTKKTEL